MNRTELEKYIRNNYGTEPDYPWIKYPNYGVFRHSSNKMVCRVRMKTKTSRESHEDSRLVCYST